MQQTQPFSFRRIRAFDEVLSDTFTFFRLHFRHFGKYTLLVAAPVIALIVILQTINTILVPDVETQMILSGIITICGMVLRVLIQLVTCIYIVLYNDERAVPDLELVRTGTRRLFLRIVGSLFVYSIAAGLGMLLFVIPGIYIGVTLTLFAIVIVEEDRKVFSAFERCFSIIKEYWWQTFGIMIIMYIIFILLEVMASAPLLASRIFTTYIDSIVFYKALEFTGVLFTNIAALLGISLIQIAAALQYYSLVERREAPGLRERVDTILPPDTAAPATQS